MICRRDDAGPRDRLLGEQLPDPRKARDRRDGRDLSRPKRERRRCRATRRAQARAARASERHPLLADVSRRSTPRRAAPAPQHRAGLRRRKARRLTTMEYVHGETVRAIQVRAAETRTEIPIACVLTIASGGAAGLHHAHDRIGIDGRPLGIVHRDGSPSNLIVSFEGGVKVVDFGVAKAADRGVETLRRDQRQDQLPVPEQASGRSVDRRSDVFSLGIVLWELLTGSDCTSATATSRRWPRSSTSRRRRRLHLAATFHRSSIASCCARSRSDRRIASRPRRRCSTAWTRSPRGPARSSRRRRCRDSCASCSARAPSRGSRSPAMACSPTC